jgi:siroheme synthase (precorrin-2 oxidase/ferrochelatase)
MDYSYDHLITRYSTVDTIYVISDGAIGNPNERAMVYTLNAENRIRINTISIQARSDFMTGLAMDNFGSSFMVQ